MTDLRAPGPRPRTLTLITTLVASAVLALGLVASPATAGPVIPSIPRTDAVDYTPRVLDDATVTESGVRELHQVGTTMYAGGHFHTVSNAARTATYVRNNLFAFKVGTGAVTSWAPNANGAIYALEPSADGRYLYIGGDFRTFDGVAANHLVRYDLSAGRVDPTFRFTPTVSRVSDLQVVGGRLFVSGTFPGGIMSVDPTTGARTSYLNAIAATGQQTGYSTRIFKFAVNPAQTQMVVIGSFTAVGGYARQQVAMARLGSAAASLTQWTSTRWNETCNKGLLWYSRDVDWSPDGSYFVVVTTGAGYPGTIKLCDSASKWTPANAPNQQPVWVNLTGGDTLFSVNVTDRAVFVSGHNRWLDNPLGRDTKGAGAVDRQGIGSIDPVSGKATSWNPSKSTEGGLGGFDLYFTSRGLWVAHFERYLGTGPTGARELHEGVGLLPF